MAVRYVLLANVGNRDLWVDGKPLNGPDLRALGEALFREVERDPGAVLPRLNAPLLRPCLDLLLERSDSGGEIEQVVLYATDQPLEVQPGFRNRDTIWSARVLERWLLARYGQQSPRGRIKRVQVKLITSGSPANFDDMYQFFGTELAELAREKLDGRHYVVALAGGVPAANATLLMRALDHFGERVEALHKSEGLETPAVLRIGEHLRQQILRAPVLELLEECRFDAAAGVLRSWQSPAMDALAAAAQALQAWMEFDVDGALRLLAEAFQRLPERRVEPLLQKLHDAISATSQVEGSEEWQPLTPQQAQQILGRWYWSASTCLEQGRRLDFIARAAGLLEAICRWVIEDALGVSTDLRDVAQLREAIDQRPQLARALEQHEQGGKERRLDIGDWLALIEGLAQEARAAGDEQRAGSLADVARCGQALKPVREARNRSIIGHDYVGVSDHRLAQELRKPLEELKDARITLGGDNPGPAILTVLRRMLSALDLPPERKNPFKVWGQELWQAVQSVTT